MSNDAYKYCNYVLLIVILNELVCRAILRDDVDDLLIRYHPHTGRVYDI